MSNDEEKKYVCALCGFVAPSPMPARWEMPGCIPKGLGAWRGHNFVTLDASLPTLNKSQEKKP